MRKLPVRALALPSLMMPFFAVACGDSFTATSGPGGSGGSTTTKTTGNPGGGGSGGSGATGGSTTGGSGGSTTTSTAGGGGTGGSTTTTTTTTTTTSTTTTTTTITGTTTTTGGCMTGADCPPNQMCQGGMCVCNAGLTDCGLACVDLNSDPNNCGMCGTVCGNACLNGKCNDPVDVAAGGGTTCAVLSQGDLYCWGRGDSGQFGAGVAVSSVVPQKVPNLPHMAHVFVGKNGDKTHVCAIAQNGDIYCWGNNEGGKAGGPDPNMIDSVQKLAPGAIQAASLGAGFSLAITGNKLLVWGMNDQGQYGVQPGLGSGTPIPVPLMQAVDAVSAGGAHACVLSAGELRCWGRNTEGQVGVGSFGGVQPPTQVQLDGGGASQVACGFNHTCVLGGGKVTCWGLNGDGQLGTGDKQSENKPNNSVGFNGGNVASIAAGTFHSGAVVQGNVWLWGNNANGQVAPSSGSTQVLVATQLAGVAGTTQLALGGYHSCALTSAKKIFCWGNNADGQLGGGMIGAKVGVTEVKFQ